ncbi:hypothetical protein [Streptomyces spiramenti]|uniref:Uncharacterized protein n=1 Tax=Streptomyces spiramenti TaxID=2720606 RepID=A0ABX1AVF9_9ACTN|nr:hypothetical protein [Streptomyces spiramenti]NJP68387.1 hypothetical protein [Streptomyces spiramenti]
MNRGDRWVQDELAGGWRVTFEIDRAGEPGASGGFRRFSLGPGQADNLTELR